MNFGVVLEGFGKGRCRNGCPMMHGQEVGGGGGLHRAGNAGRGERKGLGGGQGGA